MLRAVASVFQATQVRAFAAASAAKSSPLAGLLARRRSKVNVASLRVRLTKVKPSSSSPVSPAPIRLFSLEGKYAHALYGAGMRNLKRPVDALEKDLSSVVTMVAGHKKLNTLFQDPTVSRAAKKDVLSSALKSVTVNPITKNFLLLLAENGRINILDKIQSAYKTIMHAHRNEVSALVTTAKPLKNPQRVNQAIQRFVGKKHKVLLEFKVDPSLLSGICVNIGDKYIDLSAVNRISRLKRVLEQPV